MWLFTKIGFFSIVKRDDTWHVRARRLSDLTNLMREADLSLKVHEIGVDYQYRLIVTEEQLYDITHALARLVDYPNFKSAIKKTDQHDRAHAYMRIWYLLKFR